MVELYQNLYVGSSEDYERIAHKKGWAFLHVAKYPYFEDLVKKKGVSYVWEGNRMALDLIDKPTFVEDKYLAYKQEAIMAGQRFVNIHLIEGNKVLIHCNKGLSRSPSVARLYLHNLHLAEITEEMMEILVPNYAPKADIAGVVKTLWI